MLPIYYISLKRTSGIRLTISQLWPAERAARRPLLWSLVCGFIALAIASPCAAQSDAETAIARERFKEGVALYDSQQFDKARMAFLQAYALKPHSAVLLNLAQSELRASRYADAAANFAQYIRENPGAPAMEHARKALAEARLQVAEVNIGVSIAEATVMLDGAELGTSPLPRAVFVVPGSHVLSARIGSDSAEQVVQAEAGQQLYLTLELTQSQVPPAAPFVVSPQLSEPLAPPAENSEVATNWVQPSFLQWLSKSPGAVAAITFGAFGLTGSAVLGGFASSEYASAQDKKDRIRLELQTDSARNLFMGEVGEVSACNQVANGEGYNDEVGEDLRVERTAKYASACEQFSNNSDNGDRLRTLAFVGLGVGAIASLGTVALYFTQEIQPVAGAVPTDAASHAASRMRASLTPIITTQTQGISFVLRF